MWPWNARDYRDAYSKLRRNYTGRYRENPGPNAAASAVTDFTTIRAISGESVSAQVRLTELEQLLADHARSEGRKPSGSVKQQVEALIDRLHEQDKQSI